MLRLPPSADVADDALAAERGRRGAMYQPRRSWLQRGMGILRELARTSRRASTRSPACRPRRWVVLAALTAFALTISAAPAGAARIPVPRLDSPGQIVRLQLAERAGATLPTDPPVGAMRRALDDARPETETRLDAVADTATSSDLVRRRLKVCLSGAREGAAQQWIEDGAAGEPTDFSQLMYSASIRCFSGQFPAAASARIDQYADAASGQANEVAYDAVAAHASADPASTTPTHVDDPFGGGGSSDLGPILFGGLIVAGAVALLIRRRRS